MAEWLRRGLQILARRFDSGSGLQPFERAIDRAPVRSIGEAMTDQAPPSPLRRVRMILWAAVAVALAAFAFIQLRPQAAPEASSAGPPFAPFTLIDGNGQPFSSAKLEGKPLALYFGFTRCGDACPTALGRMARLRDRIGGPDAFNLVFITIDPEHDGPTKVGQYATLFDTPIIGLTGSKDAIAKVKRDYGIHAEPTPHAGAGMEMAHTTSVLLFDREGRWAGTIAPNETDEAALAALKRITA